MKPNIICQNFAPPERLALFMKDAIGEILRLSPYDSYLEAKVAKESDNYVMTISINYPDGRFEATATDRNLEHTVTQCTANIFTQVKRWWTTRFAQNQLEKTDWAGDFHELDGAPSDSLEIPSKKPLNILVVDDDLESITPLKICLKKLGCETFIVNNGFEAIHEIVSNSRSYDLVILDWSMPEMNGGQALLNAQRVITFSPAATRHWKNEKLPVITYSSKSQDEIQLPECRDFRHIGHWEKPSSYLNLLEQATQMFDQL